MKSIKKNFFKAIKNFNISFFIKLYFTILKRNYSKYPFYVKEFEDTLSKKFNSKYALSFSSGTAAFYASIFSLNLNKKSKVLISSLTFPTVIEILKKFDFEIYYFNIDRNFKIVPDEALNQEFDLLVITHPFGFYIDFENLKNNIGKNTKIVFDSSHSQGIKIGGKDHINFADISFMSLQGNKSISGGEGGVVFTDYEKLYLKMINNHHPGHIKNEKYKIAGGIADLKLRLHPLAALIANNDLKSFDKRNIELIKKIKEIYSFFDELNIKHPFNKESKIGGFHYGIPFFYKEKIISDVIKKYNWYEKLNSLNLKPIFQEYDQSFFEEIYFLDLEWIKENRISYIKTELDNIFKNDN